jgi:hypothetical protein
MLESISKEGGRSYWSRLLLGFVSSFCIVYLSSAALTGIGQDALGLAAGAVFIAGAAAGTSAICALLLRRELPLVLASQAGTICVLWIFLWSFWA